MQPSGEGRFASERADLPEELQKDILSQICGFGWVSRHTKAQSVNLSAVRTIDSFKRDGIAVLSTAHNVRFGQL
jgi:hypothetical protein